MAGEGEQHGNGAASGPQRDVFTLSVDVGGSGIKASVLDPRGDMVAEKVRMATPYPLGPELFINCIAELAGKLPEFDRISVGFTGMVRRGVILTAPHFSRTGGPDTPVDKDLLRQWTGFDMAAVLEGRFQVPARVANDADVQGAAVVSGKGLELVMTLGTGFGTGMFYDGKLLPHLEIAHHPVHDNDDYNAYIGDSTRRDIGNEKWSKRVIKVIDTLRNLMFFDIGYVGGGNAKCLTVDLPADCEKVDNTAGILGGIKLWEHGHISV